MNNCHEWEGNRSWSIPLDGLAWKQGLKTETGPVLAGVFSPGCSIAGPALLHCAKAMQIPKGLASSPGNVFPPWFIGINFSTFKAP